MPSCTVAGVIVSLEKSEYTTREGETVIVCANIVAGFSDKMLILNISTTNETAEGLELAKFPSSKY